SVNRFALGMTVGRGSVIHGCLRARIADHVNGTVKAVEAHFVLDDLDVLIVGRTLRLAQQHEFLVHLNRQTQERLMVLILFRRHLASMTLNRWGMPAITVDPW